MDSPWSLKRAPMAVLLMPGETKRVAIKPPIGAHEQPVVAAYRKAGEAMIQSWDADGVEVVNYGATPVPLVLLIVPSAYISVAALPWRKLYDTLQKQPWFQKVTATLGQLFTRQRGRLR